jgi:hypothetical protein
VWGRVVSEDSVPIGGARVLLTDTVAGTSTEAISDSLGEFTLRVPASAHADTFALAVEVLGFAPIRVSLAIAPHEELELLIRMHPTVVALEPLTVVARGRYGSGRLDEYFDRAERVKRSGLGRVLAYEEIQQTHVATVIDLLALQPGLTPVQMGFSRTVTGRGNCEPTFYIDGVRAGRESLTAVPVLSIEGVEIYRSEVDAPPNYRGSCGVILIWLQHGERGVGSPITWKRVAAFAAAVAFIFLVIN